MAGTTGREERQPPAEENSGKPDQPLSRPGEPLNGDKVDEYSDQSFPASDPPAFTTESGVGAPPKAEDKG